MIPGLFAIVLAAPVCGTLAANGVATGPRNYVFFGSERERIQEETFLGNANIAGAQLRYSWRELEPGRDQYQLQPILDDLAFLEQHGKRLWIQLQDVSFSDHAPVPNYLRTDPAFGGGVAPQYDIPGDDESKARFGGWASKRWDPAVRARFIKLIDVLGRALDGRIEGLNFAETALGFGESGRLHPSGFSYDGYVAGIREIMTAGRRAFSRSCVIVYANFMPGEWLPSNDRGYLRAIYAHADSIGVGVGGPDLLPHRRGQQNHSLPLIASRSADIPAGVAVQDGNLEERNPATNARVSVEELYRFARDKLRVNYIFWGTEEPYYTARILPYIRALGK